MYWALFVLSLLALAAAGELVLFALGGGSLLLLLSLGLKDSGDETQRAREAVRGSVPDGGRGAGHGNGDNNVRGDEH